MFRVSQAIFDLHVHRLKGNSMETLLSVDEAARRLGGISKWTVHAWLSQGRLQRTKVGGRTMIRESELAKVIEDGGKSPVPRSSQQTGRSKLRDAGETLGTVHKKPCDGQEPKVHGA